MLSSFGIPGAVITAMAITGIIFLFRKIFKKPTTNKAEKKL